MCNGGSNIEGKNRRKIGARYEQMAEAYLAEEGYQILQRNFYTKFGEIDLIAKDGKYLVFIEVKYRADSAKGHPLEAVDLRKQLRIKRAAQFFLLRYRYGNDMPCRFDVIGILGEELTHIKDAF